MVRVAPSPRARSLARLGLVLGLGATLAACERETLEVAPDVDLDRFQGRWHEVAHMPRIAQSDCSGTTATYTRESNDKFTFVHQCTLSNGKYQGATAAAKVRDLKTPAKLEVDFGGHVGDYWILEVAPDYRYAVVGHPSRDYLWILSRTPVLADKDLSLVLEHARQKSFDTARLEFTAPAPLPEGAPAPKMTHGCSAAPGALGGHGASLALLLALASASLLRSPRRERKDREA